MSRALLLEPISACNLRCKMCAHKNSMTGLSLEKSWISDILRDIKLLNADDKSNQFEAIRLDGNTEPLVYKDLEWLVNEIKTAIPSVPIHVITNGVLLVPEVARFLLANVNFTWWVTMTYCLKKCTVNSGFCGSKPQCMAP